MNQKMENVSSEQEMRREVVGQEATRNAMFGDIEISESSSEEEIGKFLEVYQNAVIANLDTEAKGIYNKAEHNLVEQGRLVSAIEEWEGKEGGEEVIENLRSQINALSENHVQLVGGTADNSEGEVGEVNKKLDEAIHMRDALAANRTLFVNKYRSQITALKTTNPAIAKLESLGA